MSKTVSRVVWAAAFCASAFAAGAQESPVVFFPFREATVASAVDSELVEYRYKVGEPFTNDAIIAKLDDERYRINYDRAKEHHDYMARVAKEQRELRSKDFSSEMDLRKAEYEFKQATADCEEARVNLSRCTLQAPFGGKIAEMLTQQYETVKPGQPLFRIIEDARLLAVANLPLGSVKVGRSVEIVPDNCKPVTGSVYEVSPQADNRTGTVRVRILVDNKKGLLTAGMTGMIKLPDPPKPKPAVPAKPVVAAPKPQPKPKAPAEPQIAFVEPGRPYATVQEAWAGKSSCVIVQTNGIGVALAPTNYPAFWREREVIKTPVTDKITEYRALPPVSITGLHVRDAMIGYVIHRYPRVVSLMSLKRIGELTAGLYDEKGARLAYIEPKQVTLPGSGCSITNFVTFAPMAYQNAVEKGGKLRLVLRIDSDVRAVDVVKGKFVNGGK